MPDHVRCPSCSTYASLKTLAKFNGVCHRCHKQPVALKKQWIFFAVMTVGAIAVAFIMDDELANLEATGSSKRMHVLVVLAYRTAGRTGVMTILLFTACMCAYFCFTTYRSARIDSDNSNTDDQP